MHLASLTAQPPIDYTLYSGNSDLSIAATTFTKINDTTNETLNGVANTYSGGQEHIEVPLRFETCNDFVYGFRTGFNGTFII